MNDARCLLAFGEVLKLVFSSIFELGFSLKSLTEEVFLEERVSLLDIMSDCEMINNYT